MVDAQDMYMVGENNMADSMFRPVSMKSIEDKYKIALSASIYELAYFLENRLYFPRELSGDSSGVEPPVPIPNTEVKRFSADDT